MRDLNYISFCNNTTKCFGLILGFSIVYSFPFFFLFCFFNTLCSDSDPGISSLSFLQDTSSNCFRKDHELLPLEDFGHVLNPLLNLQVIEIERYRSLRCFPTLRFRFSEILPFGFSTSLPNYTRFWRSIPERLDMTLSEYVIVQVLYLYFTYHSALTKQI